MTRPRPRVLSVAGLDPCGGAGLLADCRVIAACGGEPLGVLACRTVQNRHGLSEAVATDPDELVRALDAVRADGPIDAVKTGLLLAPSVVAAFAAWWDGFEEPPPLVVDPVLSITAGGGSAAGVARWAAALRELLVPRGAVLTPNLPELEQLTVGGAAADLLREGATAVLVTGGHGSDRAHVVDVLHEREVREAQEFRRPRVERGPVHGTGCALSTALATELALGSTVRDAAHAAGERVARWLRATPAGEAELPEPLRIEP